VAAGAAAGRAVRHTPPVGNYMLIWPAVPVQAVERNARGTGISVRINGGQAPDRCAPARSAQAPGADEGDCWTALREMRNLGSLRLKQLIGQLSDHNMQLI